MKKMIRNVPTIWTTEYGMLIGRTMAEAYRLWRSEAFWDGFRDGFTAWIWVWNPDMMPSKRRKRGALEPMTEAEMQTLARLDEMRTDDWGGRAALFSWLTVPNRSLGGARPCDVLAEQADAIKAAFCAEISQPLHG